MQNFDCGNVVTAWINRSRFNIPLLSINYSVLSLETLWKSVTYRPLCKRIETLLRYCGTWLTDIWSSLVSQTNYILHMFKAKQHLFSILHRGIHTPKTHRYPVKTVIYMVKFRSIVDYEFMIRVHRRHETSPTQSNLSFQWIINEFLACVLNDTIDLICSFTTSYDVISTKVIYGVISIAWRLIQSL